MGLWERFTIYFVTCIILRVILTMVLCTKFLGGWKWLRTCTRSQVDTPSTHTDGVSWNKLIHIKPFSIRRFDLIISLLKHKAFVTFTRLTALVILILLWDFLPVFLNVSFSRCRLIALLLLLSSLRWAPCLCVVIDSLGWFTSAASSGWVSLFLLMVFVAINRKIIPYALLNPVYQARGFHSSFFIHFSRVGWMRGEP